MILSERLKVISSISIIILLIVFFQYQSLKVDMFGDDYGAFRSYSGQELLRGFYTDMQKLLPETSVSAYRPMFQVMFHLAYSIGGFDSYNLHMIVIILQILQTFLAFLFFRMITERTFLALVSCLLFPLNPNLWMHFTWNTEIAAISGMIPALLSLISLVYYIRNPKRIMIFFHCFFALWAYLTKETYAPLFFMSLLTIIYYKKTGYRQYRLLVGCHMAVFIGYLGIRFYVLRGWGGTGAFSPGRYPGLMKYIWNYISFINKTSLFTHYLSSGPAYLLFYMLIFCIFLAALKYVLSSYRNINRQLLLCFLIAYLLPACWLLAGINKMPELFQFNKKLHPFFYEGLLFVYAIGFYTIIVLIWINRKKASNIYGKFSNQQGEYEGALHETLSRFFLYSCFFTLISGLLMFFYPESRIMNVSALGMGGVFASSFFIVLHMTGSNRNEDFSFRGGKKLLRYVISIICIIFLLVNGAIFREKYTGRESPYYEPKNLETDIYIYVQWYPYFKKYGLTKQASYLFYKLLSKGFVDGESGKLIMEKIKSVYPDIAKDVCMNEGELYEFQPSDANIYPITK